MALKTSRIGRRGWRLTPLALIFMSIVYALLVIKSYLAFRFSTVQDVENVRHATSLEPKNAAYHDLLGRILLVEKQDSPGAATEFERAVALNPYQSPYWLNLAEAYYSSGAKADEDRAIRNAIAVDPTTPSVAWNIANFELLEGNLPGALQQFSGVLRHSPERVPDVLNLCWRATHNVSTVVSILPPDPAIYLRFIELLTSQGNEEDADSVWSHLSALGKPFDFRLALFYVDYLITQKKIPQAVGVWRQLQSLSPELAKYTQPGNNIVNGEFNRIILSQGFDWHYTPRPGAEVALDGNTRHAGARSLLISYSGNVGDSGMVQDVPVQPDTWYTLAAWVKSEDLQTANGPQVVLVRPSTGDVRAATEETNGTTAWHLVHTNILTAHDVNLLRLSIARKPETTLIRGRFWITEVVFRETPEMARPQWQN